MTDDGTEQPDAGAADRETDERLLDSTNRRRLLGAAGGASAAALAGCWGEHTRAIDFQEVTVAELADRASITDHDRDELVAAIEAHGTVVGTEPSPPFASEDVVTTPSGPYLLLEVTNAVESWQELAVGFEPISSTVEGETLSAEELPPIDRSVLYDAFEEPKGYGETMSFPGAESIAAWGTRVEAAVEDTAGVFGPSENRILLRDGDRYRIHARKRTHASLRSEYEAVDRWDDPSEAGNWIAQERAIELQNLSEAEREVVRDAIDGRCKRSGTDGEAFDSIVETIQSRGSTSAERYGITGYVVRWQGATYWADLNAPAGP